MNIRNGPENMSYRQNSTNIIHWSKEVRIEQEKHNIDTVLAIREDLTRTKLLQYRSLVYGGLY